MATAVEYLDDPLRTFARVIRMFGALRLAS